MKVKIFTLISQLLDFYAFFKFQLQEYVLKLMKKQMLRLGWKQDGDYLTRFEKIL